MRLIYSLAILLYGCGSATTTSEASRSDSGLNTDSQTSESSTEETESSVKDIPCINADTIYPRLTARYCVDKDGRSHLQNYWDNKLYINCRWHISSDMRTRCLPENLQSSLLYADGLCKVALGLVRGESTRYIGLLITKGGMTWAEVYEATKPYNSFDFYYQTEFEGESDCFSTRMIFSGLKLYYVGQPVQPNTFVEQ